MASEAAGSLSRHHAQSGPNEFDKHHGAAGKTIRFDLPEGARYKVELIDTQNMTFKQLPDAKPGNFSFQTTAKYSALRVVAADRQ